eukprot:278546_1
MGVSHSSKSVVTRSVQQEALRRERQLKAEEKVMLVIGSPHCGKSYFIKKFVSISVDEYDETNLNETNNNLFIESKFQNGPFLFNELTATSIFLHATKNFKYISILNEYNPQFTYKDSTIDVVILEHKKEKKEYINYRLLFDGYFRQFLFANNITSKIPKDIGNLIESFYEKPLILNYKIPIKSTVFDFWKLSVLNKNEWEWCFKKSVCIIFIIDLSIFDEINVKTNVNKMSESIKLFVETVNNLKTNNRQSMILILNKKNKFRKKLENGININICPEFKFIKSNDYNVVIRDIDSVLRNTAKKVKAATNIFVHTVGQLNRYEIQKISTDFVHCVISYTLAKGGIVH